MFARVQTRRLTGTRPHPINQRAADLQLALLLTYITLGWMAIEGAASLLLGWASKSLLLEAFGIDSVIELFSAVVLLWRLRVEATGRADEARVEAVERRASRWVGYTLYFLVLYVIFNSAYGLFITPRVTDTHESVWGVLIGVVAKVGMPILAGYKLKVAARLNSRALRADAVESIVCGYLSIVLIVGLAATRILGWWWLDSVAALALIPFIIKEARAAISGEVCSGCDDTSSHRSIRDEKRRWLIMNVANVDDVDLECRWYPTYRSADRGNREAAAKIRTATHAGLFS